MNAPVLHAQHTAMTAAPAAAFDLAPRNLDEALKLADYLANSTLVPKEYQRQPGNILVAIQWGAEIGLKPLQAMQNIATINGRPSVWGDAQLALVRSSPACEWVLEEMLPDGTAVCTTKRRGDPHTHKRTFSDADAKQAGLAGKAGPWTQSPKRMKQLRARAFLLRDVYTDVLRGMPMTEFLWDHPPEAGYGGPTSEAAHPIPADLRAACDEAAAGGTKPYGRWWRALTDEQRSVFMTEKNYHEAAKATAIAVDARQEARNHATDATPKPAPAAKPVATQAQAPAAAPATAAAPESEDDDPLAGKTYEQVIELLNQAQDGAALMRAAEWIDMLPVEQQQLANEAHDLVHAQLKEAGKL